MKKGSILFSSIFIAIIIILILLRFLINSTFAANFISSSISKSFIGSIYWEKHSISILSRKISLYNAKVLEKNKKEVISIDSSFARFSFLGLLRKQITLDSIFIYNPNVNLIVDDSGNLNIVSLFKASKEKEIKDVNSKPVSVNLSSIHLKKGLFEYYNKSQNWIMSNNDISIDGNYNITEMDAEFNLNVGHSEYFSEDTIAIDSFTLNGAICKNVIEHFDIVLNKKGDNITAKGCINDLNRLDKVNGRIELKGDLNTDNYSFLTSQNSYLDGNIKFELNSSGEFNNPNCKLNFLLNNKNKKIIKKASIKMEILNRDLIADSLSLRLDNNINIFTTGLIKLKEAFPEGFISGKRNLNNISYDAKSLFSSNNLKRDINDRVKRIEGEINISGKGISIDSIFAEGKIGLYSSIQPLDKVSDKFNLKGGFSIKHGVVNMKSSFKSNFYGEGGVEGQYDFNNKNIAITVDNLMLDSELLKRYVKVPIEGIYTMHGEAKGRVDSLAARLFVQGDNVSVDSVKIEKLGTIITINNHIGELYTKTQIQSNAGYGELKLNSKCFEEKSFSLKKAPYVNGEISLTISDINPIIKRDLFGDMHVSGSYDGTINNGIGSIILQSNNLGHREFEIKDLKASIGYKNKDISINSLTGLLPGGNINVYGEVGNFNNFSITSNGEITLDSINITKDYNTFGKVEFKLKGYGDFKSPICQLNINVKDPIIAKQRMDSLLIDANLIGGEVDFKINSNFTSYGSYNLDKNKYSIHTTLDSTDFMTFVLPKDQGLWKGNLSGYSYVKGVGSTIDSILLDLYNLELTYDTVNIAKADAINLFYGGDSVHVKNMNIGLMESGFINFAGGFSSKGKGKIKGKYKLPYSALKYLSDDINRGAGSINGDISFSGDIKKPIIKGEFTSDSSMLTFVNIDQSFSDISFNGSFTDTSIKINNGSIKIDSGIVSFNGSISSEKKNIDSINISFNTSFNELPLIVSDEGEFTLSGDINLNVVKGKGTANGDVKLLNGIYYKDLDLKLFERERIRISDKSAEDENLFLKNIDLNVQLLPYTPVTIDNNIAYINVMPQVKLKGTMASPIISGRAKVIDGFIAFRNREFKIKRGILDFVDPYSNNPSVDIEADVSIDKWVVTIAIEGKTNDQLKFRLFSTPFLSDREILSLLLIGRPEISGIEDAISVAGDFAGEYLGKTVEKMNTFFSLPVDKVTVESESFKEGLTVNIEQDVSKYLSTIYSINMKNGEISRKAELLLKVFDNFSAKGFTETTGKKGFELEAGFGKQ